MKQIIFICTGNTCRSPMAEALFKSKLSDKEKSLYCVKSRGLSASPGDYASEYSIEIMKELGLDLTQHRSMSLNAFDLDNTDLFVCMTESHKRILLANKVPEEKIIVLDISDPYGGTLNDYRCCAKEIESALNNVFNLLRSDIIIKKMKPWNIEKAAETECISLGSEAWSKDSIKETMDNNGIFFVAYKNNIQTGHCGMTKVLDEGYIINIAVLPEFRHQGIASALTETMIEYSKNHKLRFLSLEVRESNVPAIGLYEKYKFSVKGKRKNFYSNPKENALIMTVDFRSKGKIF